MASPCHEDHSDLDSLFGDESHDEYGIEMPKSQQRSVIQLPRAAAISQNVGTIAHSSVPNSTEHPHSSGPVSSASIPLTKDALPGAPSQGKRTASPEPSQPNKKRRVGVEGPKLGDKSKLSLANLGLAIGPGKSLTSTNLQSVASLLAPSVTHSRGTPRGPKGKSSTTHNVPAQAPVALGTGTAADPVVISDEPPAPAASNQPVLSSPSTTARRLTRSQQARLLLEALPNDPSDVLSQTLRTILKNPTTAPHSRCTIPRDTAVYLANGRLTGTPFLRLLRYLAGPTRRTDPALGLTLLKKLVEAMRATEEITSKAAPASQSSAASTPMPTTPGTPSTASFAAHDNSGTFCSPEPLEPNLFSQLDLPSTLSLDGFSLPTIAEFDPAPATDIVIDPELLALSQDPGYLQAVPQGLPDLDFDLAELLGALPESIPDWSASPTLVPGAEPLPTNTTVSWDDLANIPFDIFETWLPGEQPPTIESPQPAELLLPAVLNTIPQPLVPPGHPGSERALKQNNHTPGTMRIPPRTEALALLEHARTHKKELEAKIAFARRQLWGCKIEAGVQRNLLEKLRKE